MSEVRRAQGPLLGAGLPAGRRAAGGRGPAVEVLLRPAARGRVQHDPRLGRASRPNPGCRARRSAMPSLVLEATWAAAGGTVIIYLAALTGVPPELYDAAEVDGAGVWRKVWHVHDAAAARGPAHHADPADHRDRAGVPRAVPVHRRRPGQRDRDDPAADLPLRVPQQPRRQLRRGDGAQPACSPCSSPSCPSSTSASPAAGAPRDDDHAHRPPPRPVLGTAPAEVPVDPGAALPRATRRPSQALDRRRRTAARSPSPTGAARRVQWTLAHDALCCCSCCWSSGASARCCCSAKFAVTPTQDILRTPDGDLPERHRRGRTSARPGTTSTSASTSSTPSCSRPGPGSARSSSRRPAGSCSRCCGPRWARVAAGGRAGHAVRPRRRAARAAVPDHPRPAAGRHVAGQLVLGASGCRPARARSTSCSSQRFFDNLPREIFEAARVDGAGPVPAVLVDRAAHEQADPRRGVRLRGHRVVEGLPLAAAGAAQPGPAAAVGPPAVHRGDHRQGRRSWPRYAISTLIPIVLFLVFQRMFLRGAGLGGAVKG